MDEKAYPVIDMIATGNNIRRLREERGLSVRDVQHFFGFEQPQAIYKWQKGASLPTVDNLYALGSLLDVPMDQILIRANNISTFCEQQAEACCSSFFGRLFRMRKGLMRRAPFLLPSAARARAFAVSGRGGVAHYY